MTTTIMRMSQDQLDRTKIEEGLKLTAYRDTVGIATVGYGHASTNARKARGLVNGAFYEGRVCDGLTITPAEAERLFAEDVDEIERGVSALIRDGLELSQGQFNALCDFAFQYGVHRLSGSTLIDKLNFNPYSPAVLQQFMRWTMAGGKHEEYVWRRSARRAIVYNGTPIPQKLWVKCAVVGGKPPLGKGFPFAVTADGDHIDYAITPTLQDLIDLGKAKASPYRFDPNAKTETIFVETLPDSTRDLDPAIFDTVGGGQHSTQSEASTDERSDVEAVRPADAFNQPPPAPASVPDDPLILGQPDTPEVPDRVPATASVSYEPPAGAGEAATPSAPALPPPKSPPPVIAGVDGAKPKSPWTVQPEDVHYKIDPSAGLKPLDDSDRARAFFWQRLSQGIIYAGAAGTFGNTFKGGSELLMQHAALMSIFLDLWVPIAVSLSTMATGFCVKSYGDWKRRRAEAVASQGLC